MSRILKIGVCLAVLIAALPMGVFTKLLVLYYSGDRHVGLTNRKYDNDQTIFKLSVQANRLLREKYGAQVKCYPLENQGDPGVFIVDREGFLGARRSVVKTIDSVFIANGVHPLPAHQFGLPSGIF